MVTLNGRTGTVGKFEGMKAGNIVCVVTRLGAANVWNYMQIERITKKGLPVIGNTVFSLAGTAKTEGIQHIALPMSAEWTPGVLARTAADMNAAEMSAEIRQSARQYLGA